MFEHEKLSHIVAVALLLIAVSMIATASYFDVPVRAHLLFQKRAAGSTDTSNRKTYRNEEYGFEVRYPSEWKVSEYRNEDYEYSYIGFRDLDWDKRKIIGDTVTIKIYRNISRQEAIRLAGFLTRSEVEPNDFLSGEIPLGTYFSPPSVAGSATPAKEIVINETQAIVADQIPVRIYGGEEDKYLSTGEGTLVLLIGNNIYGKITLEGPSVAFDQILSTFKFIQ